jgi:hypothetical protein
MKRETFNSIFPTTIKCFQDFFHQKFISFKFCQFHDFFQDFKNELTDCGTKLQLSFQFPKCDDSHSNAIVLNTENFQATAIVHACSFLFVVLMDRNQPRSKNKKIYLF